jgi:hypothetical protein
MKKILFGIAVSLFTMMAAQAQDKPGSPMQKRMRHADLQQLNLSDDQRASFRTTNEEFRKQMQELKKQDNITVKEWRSRMQKLRTDHKEKINGLLTNEQKNQLKKMREEHKTKMKAMSEKRMERMKERLALTDAQSGKLTELRGQTAEKLKALRENSTLTPDQKREQARELSRQNKEKMKSILTEEQLKKLKEGKHHKHGKRQRV